MLGLRTRAMMGSAVFRFSFTVLVLKAVLSERDEAASRSVSTKVWQDLDKNRQWPELARKDIKAKPNAGIAISGGGSRSFESAMGQLRGLVDLGLLSKARYLTGISGGSWAVSTFVFYKQGASGFAKDDQEFLGDVVPPENITFYGLEGMSDNCGRKLPLKNLYEICLKLFTDSRVPKERVYKEALNELFMTPAGITNDPFSLDSASVAELKTRNPVFQNQSFMTVNQADKPFPIICASLMGPTKLIPYEEQNRTYTHMEFTPLYIGAPYTRTIPFCSGWKCENVMPVVVGGFVEPFAFGSQSPSHGLRPSQANGSLEVEMAEEFVRVADVAGMSGWAPADIVDQPGFSEVLADLEPLANYWSPASPQTPPSSEMIFGDGGILENTGLMSLLRRRVRNALLFLNSDRGLRPRSKFDPCGNKPPSGKDMNIQLMAYFGFFTEEDDEDGCYYMKDQVFAAADFCPFVTKLQEAQAGGKGAVATMELVTIANAWWGIEAGIKVKLTVAHLGRVREWEDRLKDEKVKRNVQPLFGKDDPAVTVTTGPFKKFPHYSTLGQLTLTAAQANLLADMTGWVVHNNADLFKEALAVNDIY